MMKIKSFFIAIIIILCTAFPSLGGGWLDDWNINIMGVDVKNLQNKNCVDVVEMVVGYGVSHLVHEFGHYAIGSLYGMDSSIRYKEYGFPFGKYYTISKRYPNDDDGLILFYAGGFIFQSLTSIILTSIPATRHSDFTTGFNIKTMKSGYGYSNADDWESNPFSDVGNLIHEGHDGKLYAFISGSIGNLTTYISCQSIQSD